MTPREASEEGPADGPCGVYAFRALGGLGCDCIPERRVGRRVSLGNTDVDGQWVAHI